MNLLNLMKGTAAAGQTMNHSPTSKKQKKLNRYLGLGYITAGACFLFEPYLSVIDILPDSLGYLLIFLGLYRMADLDDRLGEALKGARNLALLGLARWIAMLLAFGFVSPAEQPVFMLLALFTLAVLDFLVLIPMWKNFRIGLLYLGSRYDATVPFDRSRGRVRRDGKKKVGIYNMVERYTTATTLFFVLHEILAVLPELTVLSHEKGGAELGQGTRYYDFVGLFRFAGIVVSLILGIVWLVMTVRFVRRLKGDRPFFDRMTEKYRAEILPKTDMWARRAVRASLLCLILAAVLSLDFYLDGTNILPDTIASILMLLSILFLRNYAGKNLAAQVATVAYGILSAVGWFMQWSYFGMDDIPDIFRLDEAHSRWSTTMLIQALTAALYVIAMALILKSLYGMVKRYTGLHAFREGTTYAAERSEAIHTLIRKKLLIVMIIVGLVALSTLYHWGLAPVLAEQDIALLLGISGSATTTPYHTFLIAAYRVLTEGYWFIDLCIGAALTGVTISATGEITDQMEYSSMMKD